MVAFIDELAYYLFGIAFAAFLLAYLASVMYLSYRKDRMDMRSHLEDMSVPLGFLGGYLLVMGAISQMTWFLPGAYNILFYDPMVSLGLLLLIFAFSIKMKFKLQFTGFLALMMGIMTIWYGINGYNLSLTKAPLEMLGMFVLYGLAGVFAFPVSVIMDRFPKHKRDMRLGWNTILVIFWILLVLAGISAIVIGGGAVSAHLAAPP